ncbi:MAG: class II fructose-bisphosphate aldolase [Anaerolineae bacterium]
MQQSVGIGEMIRRAYREQWALGQFNMSNLETLQAIVLAANETRTPVIVGVSMGTFRHVGLNYLRGLVQGAKAEAQVPLFFHLDHGPDFSTIATFIELGFDSVMIDTSKFPLQENAQRVREVVDYAHARGVCVEAQIGETWDEETGEEVQVKTDPTEVKLFIQETGIDYLAISFGNTPGKLEGQADIDTQLLQEVASVSTIPIVLHGGTSIPDAVVSTAIQTGAAKINIDTAIRKAVTTMLTSIYGSATPPSDPRKSFQNVRQAAKAAVIEKMRLFGALGRAA